MHFRKALALSECGIKGERKGERETRKENQEEGGEDQGKNNNNDNNNDRLVNRRPVWGGDRTEGKMIQIMQRTKHRQGETLKKRANDRRVNHICPVQLSSVL